MSSRFGKAACLAALLICSSQMHAAADPPRISIDVHDANLADVITLLAQQSGTKIVADHSIKPEKVTLHLRDVTFQEALSAVLDSHGLAVRRRGAVLLVGAGDALSRRYAQAADPQSGKTVVLTLVHADPATVAKEIAPGLPDGTVILPDVRTQSIIVAAGAETVSRAKELVAALDGPGYSERASNIAHVYKLRFAKASDAAADLKGILPDGSYLPDNAQNAILVTGDERTQRIAQQFVQSIDAASPQVLFEVRVADLQPVNDQTNVGIEFGGYDLTGQPISGAATYAFARNSIAINARLNALISNGRAQILATPKLLTLNNKEADLLIGQTYPVVYYDARVGGQQVQFVDVGVKLRLTATIGADGSVTAELHPEYSAIEGFVGGYPVIASRKADSTLRVKNDQTIVLGGLLRDVDTQTLTKIPGLGDLPFFGKLFQNRSGTHQRDEVVFLITPHVIFPSTPLPTQ